MRKGGGRKDRRREPEETGDQLLGKWGVGKKLAPNFILKGEKKKMSRKGGGREERSLIGEKDRSLGGNLGS